MCPLMCCMLLVLISAVSVNGGGNLMQLKIDAADHLTGVYLDGKPYGNLYYQSDWRRMTKINIEGNFCLLAFSARCERDTNCFGGLVFSDDECQVFSNSSVCKCTKSVKDVDFIWYRLGFRDDNWPAGFEHYPVSSPNIPYRVMSKHLCANASWIWTASIYEENIYCRCTFQVNGGWSDWSECVNGIQERECNNPAPSCNGALCEGSSTRSCTSAACTDNCDKCDSNGICTKCVRGYFLKNSQCKECKKNCADCTDESTCTSCKSGFYLKNKHCEACSPGCSQCQADDICTQCFPGYYLSKDNCEPFRDTGFQRD